MGRLPRGVVWTLLLSILIGQSVAQGDFGPPDSYDLDLGSTPADIVFVVDTSGFSNSTESLNQEVAVKGFLTGFLENADINSGNVKVAMVTYSTHPKVIFDLNKYSTKTDMEDAVFLADFEEEEPRERNLADALSLVRTKILVRDRRDAPNFVLLLMSGKSDRNSVRTLQEADGLKFARANIFGIGISLDDDDAEEMFEVSSKPTMENTFLISSVYELEMLRELVFMQIFARAEQAFKAPAAGSETLDLAFLLHYSNSVSREDFQRILDFMKNILQYSDIDDDKLRVGAVVFRKRGIPLFDFNNYYSQEEVFGGIDQINYNYRSKTSSIASGFDTVRTSLFTRTGGEREPAPNLVILITDSNADTDVDQTITAVERMKADGAAVYVVGINVTYPEELLSIASNPSYNVLVKDASELEGHDEQFHNDFVALRAKGFPVVIPALESSTSGTFADTTPVSTQNSDEAEIVFLVHASKKTTTKDFKNNLIQYIIGIIQRADTTKNKFGVVMYGDSPEVVLKLTSFPKAKLVKKALKKIKPNKRSKRADLLKALSFVREQVFNGDDPNLPNGIVLIRDQKSKRVDDNHLGTELSLLEASGTNLFQIGIGQQVENDKESELVTNTFGDDSVTNVGSYGELSNSPEVVKLLSRKIRSFHQEEIDLIIAVHTQHNTALKNVKKHIQVLLKDILSAVDINSGAVQVSIVTFGAKTKVHFPLNAFNKDKKLMKAFKKIKRKEYRSKGSDLMTLLTTLESDVLTPHSGDRQGVENLILVITDSASSSDLNMLKQKAEEMKKGNTIFAIGVDSANEDELKALASSPENEFFYNGKKYDDLTKSPELREQMIRNVKIFESLTVPATTKPKKTTPKPKVTKADTTTTTPSFTTTTRSIEIETTRMTTRQRLFTTTTTPVGPSRFYVPLSVSEVADIVLLVHLSPRITEMEFITVQEFLKSLVSRADIANGKAQIGLVFYGADPEIIFHINQYNDIALMQKSIDGMRADLRSYTSDASTAIASAKQMLSPYFNRRDDVPAAMIFIADDPANTNFDVMRDERDRAIEDEIRILTVGIGVSDKSKLESLASDPDFIMNYDNVWMLNDAENDLTEKIFAFQNDGVTEDKLFEETTLAAKTTTPADTTVSEGIITKSDGIVLELPSSLVDPNKCSLGNSDLVIILDASTSVTQQNYDKMLQFTKDLLQNADIDSGAVRVGILIYSTEVQVIFNLNEYSRKADVFAAIDKIPYIYGSTNTADALQTMHAQMFTPRNGDRPNVPNTGIIITDGVSNINSRRTISEADDARTAGIHVYAIGIGLTDTRELDGIANTPKTENSFNVQTFDELVGLDRKIFSALCPEKAVTVPVTTPKPKSSCGLSSVDVVIIIDASTSVTEPNFKLMLEFCKDIVKGADIDSGSVRVGVLIYSTEVEIQFHLNRYSTNAQVIDAIDKIPYIYGSTNTADALLTMHQTMFTPANGDRQGVENVAIVLTDGVSNINSRRTIKEAVTARSKDIEVYVIGISLTDTREVEGMASEPKDKYLYNVRRFEELQGLEEDIFGAGEGGDCATPAPATPAPATLAPKTECGLSKVDAVIILDASTSVTEPNFKKMLSFCKEIVDKAAIDSGSVRIGVLIYSTEVEIEFHLNKYTNTADIKAAIDRIPYIYGSTNSADALKTMHEVMFTARNGDRPDVDNIAFMITDGISNINGRRTIPEAENAQGKDIRVYAIGIGLTDTRELEGMASEPKSENMFNVREFDELTGLIDTIFGGAEECALSEPPVANAGPDVTRRYPSGTITLDGRRSSDDNGIVTYTWSQGGRDLFTGATFDLYDLREGEYEYNLTVVDEDGQSDSDTVRVIIEAPDNPPVADAGRDVSIQLPVDTVTLDGSRSSDDIRIVQYLWTLVSGAPGVQTTGDTSSKLLVEGLAEGDYTFALSVFDALGQADEDEVTISVRAGNQPPKADAGEDVEIQLPVNEVTLDGRRSTDDVRIARYRWRIREGDENAVVMDGDRSAVLQLSNLTEGTYGFSLTVADNEGERDTDYVNVVVKPEPTPTCGFASTDLVFVVDASTSVTEANFKKQLAFMKNIVNYADIDSGSVRVGALIYSTEVEVQFYLNQYSTKNDVIAAIDKIPYIYGSTNTADGLQVMRDELFSFRNGDRDDAPNIAMVITDGVSNINGRRTIPEAITTRDLGIKIFAVGIGLTDTRELEGIASIPSSDNAFAVSDFDELVGLEQKIFTSICDKPSTTPPTTPTTTTTTQATPTTTSGCGLAKTDLVFILDASTSVTDANFQKMRDFLKEFLSNADIDSGSVRVGVNIYSTDVQVEFHLNRYTKAADVMSAIDNIPYIYGSTNTADALQSMANVMFTPQNGDRPDAPNVCILLTDGVSNINSRRTIPEAERARAKNVHLYVIGIGLTDTREVTAIATPPASKNLFSVNSFDELKGLHKTILNTATCKDEISEPPVADAGSDRTIQLPLNSITLSGDGSRDDVGIVRYEWSQLSGPRVNVRDTNDPMLSVDRLTEGVYEFELNVTDVDGQSDTDTVVITVLPEPDLPPRADAGPDKQVKLPNDRVTLSGRGSSDDKRITRWVWRLVNGNARGVTMSGQNTDTLDLSRLQEGTYTFGLTVYDAKGQMDEDEVTITVAAAPDAPPVANAGQDYTIQLPDDSVTLDGSRSSDDVRVITYRWKMTQGYPGSVRMSGERTPRLNVNGLSEGEYVFTLTVTDGKEQLDEDEARVIVKKAPRVEGYDVIFVLDSSVTPEHFRWMNNYARAVVREMSIDDGEFRVGYLIYSNSAYRQFDLQDYGTRSDVLSAIDKVGYRPGTKNTAAALKYARKQMFTPSKGDREYAKNYLILLTGDNPSDDPFGAATEACQLQAEGVGMFGVGFGDFSNRDELTAYSSVPNDEYQSVMRQESDQSEAPGLMLYNLKNRTPRPSACPVVVTTPYNGDCFASGDIVFILDSSGSVGQDNFYRVLNFTYSTIDGLDIDSGHFRVGVTTFSDSSRLDFNLNDFSNKQDIHDALTQVRYMYGNTHTAHALRRARLEMFQLAAGDRPDVPNVIVIITDGQSNINHEMTIPEARHLKAAGVTIITLAVGFTSETSELVGLTSPPISENLVYTEDYESLSKVKDKLIEPLCHDSNMCRSSPCQNGGVCMDGIRSYICICPDDFFGDTCSKHCGEPSDVVIVLDSSNTVGEYNFGRLKEYSEHLVREMNKDSCDVNIGFMKYSSNAMVQVHLGTYDDTETNVRAVEQISYSRGRANMAAAFRSLRTEMFNGRGGDRPGARNIAYFLTDGTNDAESEMAESEAEQAISSGIRIVPIGINLRERFELDNIAEKQNLNVIEINDEPALIENTDVILRPLYEGSNDYCAENPCSNGGQCVNEPFGYSCECDIGYTGDTCTQRCSAKGDVVFAVDTSRYVTRKELKSIRRFLRSVVKRLKFNKNEFSVGMVQFTDWAQVSLTLSQGKSKKAVRKSIAGLRVHGGDPQPSIALAKAKYRIFDAYGEDKDRPNYLILITKSMRGEEDILTEANKLKLEGTRILGVGLGLTANEREYLESSVSIPFRETAMFADDRKEMDDLADRVVEYMCDDENLCAENPCRNGGVCQRLGGDFYCDCGVGYAGRYCENTCNARADIVFLLDSSGSIGHKDFRRVKKFVHNMVSDLQIGKDASRIGLATYSSKSRHGFFMSKYDDLFKLQNAIAGISYEYGNSNAAEGLRLVREHYFNGRNGDRSDIQDFLVVITDGVSNVQPDQTLIEANLIKEKGVHVYAVGIGEFDPAELNEIASKPASENAYILSDYSGLDNISNSIIKQTCRDPSVCDENPCRNGGVCVPGINGLFCECRRGYRGVHCEESCVSVKDIFFLLDSSDSVGTQNFEQAKKFINNIIEEFSSKDSFNRFSLLTYSDEVQIVFSLGRYNSLNIIQNAVKYARYRPGNTNTASALRVVDELSTEDLGDRYDAENIVFVITDGTGNVNEDDTIAAADNIKNKGARVITVGINMDDPSEVESMASSKRDSFKINKYDDLEGVLEEVVQNTCKNGNVIEKK
ncbi:uncharacterized protein LOC128240703 isoform X11 [Mya arenaria]|uniref:uncharacterized protein LOC128240703 isoform X11 n=1 Tax=Mya arenaria TaxID=6604 RepID=UPI0022E33871|nr:uncharacterized protein LOC128240703 isoform X11 [Mya arenaria]